MTSRRTPELLPEQTEHAPTEEEHVEAAAIPASAVTVKYDCGRADQAAKMNCANVWPLTGTEVRNLAAYDGKVFMGIGLWMDAVTPGDVVKYPGAAILRLDSADGQFQVEHSFRSSDTAVCLLYAAVFEKPVKATVFIASCWHQNFCDLYTRDYGSASWHFAQCIVDRPGTGNPAMQIRSAITFTDPVTSTTLLFLGQGPGGIFSLGYDKDARGGLAKAKLEFDSASVPWDPSADQPRVMSFAILGGELYATITGRLYKRTNGINPCWHCVHEDPGLGASQSGWRGLTPLGQSATSIGYFFVAREGAKGAILKLVPPAAPGAPWTQTVVYDIVDRLSKALTSLYGGEVKAGYNIAAYNDMVWFRASPDAAHWSLFVGLETALNKYPPSVPVLAGSNWAANGYYLVWNFAQGEGWRLNQLPPVTSQAMVACRAGLVSPFGASTSAQPQFLIGGYDCNAIKAHNTAWLVSVPIADLTKGALA